MINNKVCSRIKMNIGQKLVIAYIIIIAVPLIILSIFGFKYFSGKLENSKLKENEYILEEEKLNIENNIEAMQMTAELVTSNKKLINFIDTDKELSNEAFIDYSLNIFSDIQKIQANNPLINRIKFFIKQNRYIPEIYPYIYMENTIENKDWYNSVMKLKGKEFWVVNNIEDKNNSLFQNKYNVVSIYRSINIPSTNYIGIIEVNMLQEDFFRKVFYEASNNDYQFLAIDKFKNIIAPNGLLNNDNISYDYIKEKFYENKNNNKKGNFIIKDKGKRLMVSYVYIEAIQSYIIKVDTFKEVLKSIAINKNIFIFSTTILLILLSVVIYIITYHILRGLKNITSELKKMKKGDFDVHLQVQSRDEVGELASHFEEFSNKINELVSDIINKETIAKEAELKSLQNQIDAHFLYNVLENIKMMAEIDEKYDISDAVTSLGNLMRYNMKWDSQYVTFMDEINYIKDYISLMNIRFNNKIELIIDAEEEVNNCKMLKMSLQPIVENCVKHGLREKILEEDSFGKIYISAFLEEDIVRCEIFDNGIGMTDEELKILRNSFKTPDIRLEDYLKESDSNKYILNTTGGIGLKNVYERIKLFLGSNYTIKIYSKAGEYTKVILKLPIIR